MSIGVGACSELAAACPLLPPLDFPLLLPPFVFPFPTVPLASLMGIFDFNIHLICSLTPAHFWMLSLRTPKSVGLVMTFGSSMTLWIRPLS